MAQPGRQLDTQQVHYLRKRITYADYGTTVTVGRLPANAIVIYGGVQIHTAFNSSGTDLLDVGFAGGSSTDDPDGYATDLTLAAVGFIPLDELGATTSIMQTTACTVTASPAQGAADATAGVADVIIAYVVDNDG